MTRKSVAIAIYNRGTALVQDSRTMQFEAGMNTVNFNDVAAGIEPSSVQFISLTDPTGTVVLEQNYLFDLVDRNALLERYLDQTIEVVLDDGSAHRGMLLSGRNDEIIMQTDGGKIAVLSLNKVRDLHFPALPGGLITRPTLRWLVRASKSGEQDVHITYLTDGLNWSANYILLLSRHEYTFDLTGWIKLTNQSVTAFTDARVKLIAGEVAFLPVAPVRREHNIDRAPEERARPPRDFSQYKLYEIPKPVSLAANETKQIEFVTAARVKFSQMFVTHTYFPETARYGKPYRDPYGQGAPSETSVSFYLEFVTNKESGLDADLPRGVMRVYQPDIDGVALLIGEDHFVQTPKGETVSIELGKAFDLVAERKRLGFRWMTLNTFEESFQIRLRNRKEMETVEIRVPEQLFRWYDWEITATSMAYTKTEANGIEFRPQVAPGEEVVITYTVRYDFPPEPSKN